MTEEQRQIFWSKFKVLEEDRMHYDKPPTNWEPPKFVDMTKEQLEAYWNGFRKIIQEKVKNMPDGLGSGDVAVVPAHCHEPDQDLHATHSEQNKVQRAEVSNKEAATAERQLVPVRCRGKTSPSKAMMTREQFEALRMKGIKNKAKRPSDKDPQKRKYTVKAKISRDGKRSCLSIWAKVQLFKDIRFSKLGTMVGWFWLQLLLQNYYN